jgi:ABC-type Fe3+ transport system substrate-binding protein
MTPRLRTMTPIGIVLGLALIACGPAPSSTGPAGAAPAGSGAPSRGQEHSAPQELIAAARSEGKLVLVWSEGTLGGIDTIRQWADGFNRLYGLSLDIQFTPGPPFGPMAARTVEEYRANRPATTDILLTGANELVALLDADALAPIPWASWAPNIQDPELVAGDGAAVEISAPLVGIVYNSQNIRADMVPKSMQDLLKPQYKGRVASSPYAALFDRLVSPELWGEQRVLEYATQLSGQLAGLMGCSEYERIANGEFDILAIACNLGQARTWQARGAPVAYAIPSDAAMIQPWLLGVPRTAPHPNAAKLWVNYMLSREAQEIMFAATGLDHYRVDGSQTASEIQRMEAAGVRFHHVGLQFYQRNDRKRLLEVGAEVQRIFQTKQ